MTFLSISPSRIRSSLSNALRTKSDIDLTPHSGCSRIFSDMSAHRSLGSLIFTRSSAFFPNPFFVSLTSPCVFNIDNADYNLFHRFASAKYLYDKNTSHMYPMIARKEATTASELPEAEGRMPLNERLSEPSLHGRIIQTVFDFAYRRQRGRIAYERLR